MAQISTDYSGGYEVGTAENHAHVLGYEDGMATTRETASEFPLAGVWADERTAVDVLEHAHRAVFGAGYELEESDWDDTAELAECYEAGYALAWEHRSLGLDARSI